MEAPDERRRAYDLAADPRALTARVRTKLHRVLGALARRDWEEALAVIRQRPDSDLPSWTADRLKAEMTPYFTEHKAVITTPLARSPRNTVMRSDAPRTWEVQQCLIDPPGDEDWAIFARVDLTSGPTPAPDESPIIELVRVGR